MWNLCVFIRLRVYLQILFVSILHICVWQHGCKYLQCTMQKKKNHFYLVKGFWFYVVGVFAENHDEEKSDFNGQVCCEVHENELIQKLKLSSHAGTTLHG